MKEIANTKASKNAIPKGFLGRAGPSKERGEVENSNFETKIDGCISFRKLKIIHPRVAKYHKMFEGNRENVVCRVVDLLED